MLTLVLIEGSVQRKRFSPGACKYYDWYLHGWEITDGCILDRFQVGIKLHIINSSHWKYISCFNENS